jgi:protein TonB
VSFELIETRLNTTRCRLLGPGSITLAAHAVLIAGVVYLSSHATRLDSAVHADTTMVFLDQPQEHVPPPPPAFDTPLQGFQTIVVPTVIPTSIPPVDLTQHFDVKDYSGTGVEGGRASGVQPSATGVYADAVVEEHPTLVSAGPDYPDLMRQAGIRGRVVLQAIVDTSGRVEPGSIKILRSPNPGFDGATREWAARAQFRPARLEGRAVRVLIRLPIDFSTEGGD